MNTSRKYRVLFYTVINLAAPFFSAVAAIQGKLSLQMGITIYLASAAFINLLFWLGFRIRDKVTAPPTDDKVAKSAKVSVWVKAFCYAGMNFGVLFFSFVGLIQGAPVQTIAIIYFAAAAWINLMLWLGFRVREKGSL